MDEFKIEIGNLPPQSPPVSSLDWEVDFCFVPIKPFSFSGLHLNICGTYKTSMETYKTLMETCKTSMGCTKCLICFVYFYECFGQLNVTGAFWAFCIQNH